MKKIELTRGLFAFVDDCDYARVIAVGSWCAVKRRNTYYAVNGKRRLRYMHRLILELSDGEPGPDHEDGNGLNNQRFNLRAASVAQNGYNAAKCSKPTSSKFKGVHLFKRTGKYQAYIHVAGKRKHLGYFANEEDAARAYNAASEKHHKEFGRQNDVPPKK